MTTRTTEGKQGPNEKYRRLIAMLAELADLQGIGSLLNWDQQTMMPRAGAPARGNQLATLNVMSHDRATSAELGELLDELREYEASMPYDSDEASTIRVARRDYEEETRLPGDLVARWSRASAEGYARWLDARESKNFQVFLPALTTNYELAVEVAEALGYEDHPMDALLNLSEPGITVRDMEKLFDELRGTLVPLAKEISDRSDAVSHAVLHQSYPGDRQLEAAKDAVRAIGFDLQTRGRVDFAVHPFSTPMSPNDVRITTRIDEQFLAQCFFALLHEAGHGTYMQGIPQRLSRSILGRGASAGLHESQSRLWENIVGRSRPFWEFFYPTLQRYFPDQLGTVSLDSFYGAVNRVKPSLIRVEADEVTYNLHIMVRFELEKAVFDGDLKPRDLASAWNEKFREYLGIEPENDLVGVLQDIHWSGGFGAAFQSYTIGNVASVQLYDAALKEHPDLPRQFARGEFGGLLHWMNTNMHDLGRKLKPQELLTRIAGQPLTAGPYLAYLTDKFGELYGL